MEVFIGAEKILASPDDRCVASIWITHRHWRQYGNCPIHLHTFLKVKTTKDLQAILVIVSGLLVLYIWLGHVSLVYAACGIGVGSLLFPFLGKGIVWLWYKIAEVLGYVNSRIILSLIYWLFLVPLGLVYKVFNKDTMAIKKSERGSTFVERNHQFEAKDLENPW